MAGFGKKRKRPKASTPMSSMSDIVFMFLFFFMVTTTIRETEVKVIVRLPEATELAKLERKDLTSYINMGSPTLPNQARFGTNSQIQLNDSYRTIEGIREFIASERDSKNEVDRPHLTVALRIDEETRMGIVTDVKQELRRCNALKITYLARKGKNLN